MLLYCVICFSFVVLLLGEALSKLKSLLEIEFKARRISLRHYHSHQAGELQESETMQYLERVVHAFMRPCHPFRKLHYTTTSSILYFAITYS
jgi:hypothetical protein